MLIMNLPKSLCVVILTVVIAAGCSDSEKLVAFKNVRLVPMTAEKVIPNQSVLIRGDRIYKIGKADKLKIPQKAKLIDGNGAYLMPGLADMHVHLTGEWPLPQLDLFLANGVTTVRDLDGRDFMLQWRNEIKAGQRTGSTIYAAGPIIRGDEKNVSERISKRKSGYEGIKLYSYFAKNSFQQTMMLAKEQNSYTVGHIPFSVGLDGVIAEGINEIAHIEELIWEFIDFDRNQNLKPKDWFSYLKKAILRQYKPYFGMATDDIKSNFLKRVSATVGKLESKNINICTTLYLDEVIIQKLFEPQKFLEQPTSAYLPQKYINAFLQGKEKHQLQFQGGEAFAPLKYVIDKMLLNELHRADIPLILGTDAGTGAMGIVPGFSIHEELRILTENGFTPYEAIKTATVNASRVVAAMIGNDDFGTIEIGKRADFILLETNPLDNVASIKKRLGVMAAGSWFGEKEIQKMLDPALLPTIPVIGGVVNIRDATDKFITAFDVIIGQSFDGKLPDDIDSITVTGPQGVLPIQKDDFTFWPSANDFYAYVPGSPQVGAYKFTVTSGNRAGSAIDTQSITRPIPVPDISTLSPTEGATLDLKTPTFSWGAVKYFDAPIYYLFQIYDSTGEQVYRKGRTQNMTDHTVPAGILKPGKTYNWRVRISDSGHWMEEQNRSHTKKLSFRMAETLK